MCRDKNLILRKILKESRRKIREKEEIKDKRYINLHDSGGHGNDSSACATVAVRNLSFNNDNGQRLGVNVFSW